MPPRRSRSIAAGTLAAWVLGGCFTGDYLDGLHGQGESRGDDETSVHEQDSSSDAPGESESGSTTGLGGSDSSTSTLFIDVPDAGSGEDCDLFAQNCPAAEKCMPFADDGGSVWNATKCVPVDPDPQQPGEPCAVEGFGTSGIDDCARASMCWDVEARTLTGVCVAFCTGSLDAPMCADAATSCIVANGGVLPLCLFACDPLAQNCPDPDDACYPADDLFVCAPDASGTEGGYGDACEFVNVCDPGLACVAPEEVPGCPDETGCCTLFCDVSQPASPCPGSAQGQECTPWFAEGRAPLGFEDVGACTVQ